MLRVFCNNRETNLTQLIFLSSTTCKKKERLQLISHAVSFQLGFYIGLDGTPLTSPFKPALLALLFEHALPWTSFDVECFLVHSYAVLAVCADVFVWTVQ